MDTISTGSLALDLALGAGGVPRGCITVISGAEGSGKTTLACSIAASAQRAGGVAAFIDMEYSVDPAYARALGVDIDALLFSSPSTAEEALGVLETLARSGGVDVIILDSVAALLPRAERDGVMGENHWGEAAPLLSRALRRIHSALQRTKAAAVFTNQSRERVDVAYGSPELMPGGRALKFYASVLLEIRCREPLAPATTDTGNRVSVRVIKNKFAPPGRVAEFEISCGLGITRDEQLPDIGSEQGTSGENDMLNGLRSQIFSVTDLAAAKAWYTTLLGDQPYFDEPFYVGFNIGGYELGLMPDRKSVV